VSRLPLRLRLTLGFALAMAVVLGAVGALLYVRLDDALSEQLDESLEVRAQALADGGGIGTGDEENVAQRLDPDGSPTASSPGLGAPLVTPEEAGRAQGGSFFLTREVDGEPMRLLVTPTLVVGASLEDRDEALDELLAQLLIVGPLALLLASAAGYFLATAALRPVEEMRREAAEISGDAAGRRLPLPRARDEIHRLGETLNAMLGRLQDSLARERRFVADASHELRTPLALLQTELELALRHKRTPGELEEALRSARDEVDRLSRLAEDLLVLARLDEGRLRLRTSEVQARELLEAVARRFDSRASAEGRALEVEADLVSFPGDRLRLEQALGNLVDNALRHGEGTVRLAAETRDGEVDLRVADEGPGFADEVLPVAFERFTREDEARGNGASGLGLAIVDAIARAHGGSARAANEPDGGAVVTLVLPDGSGRPV
jgi:two-component system, OmpR family, sensor kinase